MASRSAGRSRYQWGLLLLAAVLLVAWLVVSNGGQSDPAPGGSASSATTTDPDSGLLLVSLADLPPEAAQVVDLIDAGGPFAEDEDGGTFQNREGLLPDRPRGYYREYTVPTPGSADRGARRIIGGEGGELYWTGDHYRSFARIARQ